MTAQRNEAIGQMEEQKHKVSLLQEHMTDLKIKLSRYQQEKLQSERQIQHLMMMKQQPQQQHQQRNTADGVSDPNSTTTWITPPNGSTSHMTGTDTEYYQRKYNESNQKVQSYQVMMIEKNRQIEELRYQIERNMNQQQYAHLQPSQRQPPLRSSQSRNNNDTTSTGLSQPSSSQQIVMDSALSYKRPRL